MEEPASEVVIDPNGKSIWLVAGPQLPFESSTQVGDVVGQNRVPIYSPPEEGVESPNRIWERWEDTHGHSPFDLEDEQCRRSGGRKATQSDLVVVNQRSAAPGLLALAR